jgi:phosphate-selective porin OprO and OprP
MAGAQRGIRAEEDPMNFVWSAVLALAIGGAAYADDDDEAKTPARTYTQAEVEALLDLATRVAKLEELVQDPELEKLKAAAAKEKQDEQKGLPERMSALEKKMGSAGQTWDASKMLSFSTPDGNFTAKIGGRFYFVYRHIFDDGQNDVNGKDGFFIDTARFQLDGTFYKDFVYRIEGEAKSGSPTAPAASDGAFRFNDVWMGWTGLGDWVGIYAGIMKLPMSQEETTSSRFIDFAERSVLNRITPGRDVQLQLRGALFDKVVEWALGAANGHTNRENQKFTGDLNEEKDFFIRVMATPLKNSDMALFKQTRIGVDFSVGRRDNANTAIANVSSGDLGLPAVLTFTPPAGTFIKGNQSRLHLNYSWLYGPMSLRAEYAQVKADIKGPAPIPQNNFIQRAWYVQATYLLTGEEKTLENRIKPKNNFDPLAGGWGAFELAARWAVIDCNDGKAAGIVAAANNHWTHEVTLGVNWWMTPNVRLMIDWEHFGFEQKQPLGRFGGLKKTEDEIYIRWQIDF